MEHLHGEGWMQAVASSAPRRNVETVLEALGLGRWFQATAAAEDVQAGKPDPQVFLVAASRLGTEPRQCIVVEDAQAGVEAARRAGMRSIGVGRNSHAIGANLTTLTLSDLKPDAFTTMLGAD